MIRVLLIGGPLDGRRIDVDDHTTEWRAYVPPDRSISFDPTAPFVAPDPKIVTYKMRRGSDGRMDIDTHFLFERTGIVMWWPEENPTVP